MNLSVTCLLTKKGGRTTRKKKATKILVNPLYALRLARSLKNASYLFFAVNPLVVERERIVTWGPASNSDERDEGSISSAFAHAQLA